MFSLSGEVIGVVSHMLSRSGGYEGLGFVVSSNMARRLLLEEKSVWTGMEGYELSGDLARALNVPQPVGILVQRIAENSPAAKMGLKAGKLKSRVEDRELILGGDIILEVQGINLSEDDSLERLRKMLQGVGPGEEIAIIVWRNGQRETIQWAPF
jgi:S1-C subfamily serine protease